MKSIFATISVLLFICVNPNLSKAQESWFKEFEDNFGNTTVATNLFINETHYFLISRVACGNNYCVSILKTDYNGNIVDERFLTDLRSFENASFKKDNFIVLIGIDSTNNLSKIEVDENLQIVSQRELQNARFQFISKAFLKSSTYFVSGTTEDNQGKLLLIDLDFVAINEFYIGEEISNVFFEGDSTFILSKSSSNVLVQADTIKLCYVDGQGNCELVFDQIVSRRRNETNQGFSQGSLIYSPGLNYFDNSDYDNEYLLSINNQGLKLWELNNKDFPRFLESFEIRKLVRKNGKSHIVLGSATYEDDVIGDPNIVPVGIQVNSDSGDIEWFKVFLDYSNGEVNTKWWGFNDVNIDSSGSIVFCGTVLKFDTGRRFPHILKLDSLGCFNNYCDGTIETISGYPKPNFLLSDRNKWHYWDAANNKNIYYKLEETWNGKFQVYESMDGDNFSPSLSTIFGDVGYISHENDTPLNPEFIYNFNLEIDDSFKTTNLSDPEIGAPHYLIVKEKDSINLLDGSKVARLSLQCEFEKENISPTEFTWIEIIGSTNGLFQGQSFCKESQNLDLVCFHSAGELMYVKENYNGCLVSTTQALPKEAFIYPNPVKASQYIQFGGFEFYPLKVKIYDTSGRIINSQVVLDNHARIKCDLNEGLYFLSVMGKQESSFLYTKFLVVN